MGDDDHKSSDDQHARMFPSSLKKEQTLIEVSCALIFLSYLLFCLVAVPLNLHRNHERPLKYNTYTLYVYLYLYIPNSILLPEQPELRNFHGKPVV